VKTAPTITIYVRHAASMPPMSLPSVVTVASGFVGVLEVRAVNVNPLTLVRGRRQNRRSVTLETNSLVGL
jgi:hypothetical protein